MTWQSRDFWTITFSAIDDDLAIGKAKLNVDVSDFAFEIGDLHTMAQDLATGMSALLETSLFQYSISAVGWEDTLVGEAGPAESDVEDKGVFLLRSENNFSSDVAIPGIDEGKLVATGVSTGIQIDTSDADVLAFIALLTTMQEVGVGENWRVVDSRGDPIVAVADAYKRNAASQKSRNRRG